MEQADSVLSQRHVNSVDDVRVSAKFHFSWRSYTAVRKLVKVCDRIACVSS